MFIMSTANGATQLFYGIPTLTKIAMYSALERYSSAEIDADRFGLTGKQRARFLKDFAIAVMEVEADKEWCQSLLIGPEIDKVVGDIQCQYLSIVASAAASAAPAMTPCAAAAEPTAGSGSAAKPTAAAKEPSLSQEKGGASATAASKLGRLRAKAIAIADRLWTGNSPS